MNVEILTPLSEEARQSLGVSEDLFSLKGLSPVFFNSWVNQTQLIEHLVLFSNVLMVMNAKRGAGKSTFASFLVDSLPSEIETVNVSSDALSSNKNELIRQIASAIKCEPSGNLQSEKLKFLHQRSKELQQHFLFIIDDADGLTEENLNVISELIQLSEDNEAYIHFFLLGFQRLKAKVRDLSLKESNCQFHVLELSRLKLDEVTLYLNHCYSHAKGEPSEFPLSDEEIAELYQQSDGNLPRLQSGCRQLLEKKFGVVASKQTNLIGKRLSRKNLLTVVACFSMAVVAGFFLNKEPAKSYQEKSLATKLQATKNLEPINFSTVKQEFDRSQRLHLEKQKSLDEQATNAFRVEQADNLMVKQLPLPKKAISKKIEMLKRETNQELPSKDEEVAALTASRQGLLDPSPVVIDKVVVLPTPKKESPAVIAPTLSTPKSKMASGTISTVTKNSKAPQYAIQLIGGRNLDGIKLFVYQRNLQKEVIYYQVTDAAKPWYIAVLGPYTDKAQAYKKLKSLPASVKHNKPWVRTVNALGKPHTFKTA